MKALPTRASHLVTHLFSTLDCCIRLAWFGLRLTILTNVRFVEAVSNIFLFLVLIKENLRRQNAETVSEI